MQAKESHADDKTLLCILSTVLAVSAGSGLRTCPTCWLSIAGCAALILRRMPFKGIANMYVSLPLMIVGLPQVGQTG